MPSKSSRKDASSLPHDKKSKRRSKKGKRESRRHLDNDDDGPRSDEDSKKPGDGFSSSDDDKKQREQDPKQQPQQQPSQQQSQPTSGPPPTVTTAGPGSFVQNGHGFFKDGEPESEEDDDEPDVAIAVDDDDLDEVEPLLMFEEQFIVTDSDSDSSSESSGARSDDNNQGGEAKASAGGYRLAKNAQTFVEEQFRSGVFIEVKASSAAEAAAAAAAGTPLDGMGGKAASALALRCEITLTCAGFKVMSMSIVMGLLVRSLSPTCCWSARGQCVACTAPRLRLPQRRMRWHACLGESGWAAFNSRRHGDITSPCVVVATHTNVRQAGVELLQFVQFVFLESDVAFLHVTVKSSSAHFVISRGRGSASLKACPRTPRCATAAVAAALLHKHTPANSTADALLLARPVSRRLLLRCRSVHHRNARGGVSLRASE
jgi:hypothetical protein